MEWSPSGKGLRIVFRCIDKEKLIPGRGKVNLVGMDGELFVRSGHVTITGNHIAGEEIKDIRAKDLYANPRARLIFLKKIEQNGTRCINPLVRANENT